jgi:RNA polymerase sigma-70 factor (ECF subfamily)
MTDPRPDAQLVHDHLAGDPSALAAMFDRFAPGLFDTAAAMTRDRHDAADLVQDVFVRAFGQLVNFRGDSAFTTWLHRIAVTTALNQMRKVKRIREREEELDDADAHAAPAREADPDLKVRLHAAIDALPEGLRMTVLLHDLEGYTHAEIGTMLGVAEGTSKARLFEARGKLRDALRDFNDFR